MGSAARQTRNDPRPACELNRGVTRVGEGSVGDTWDLAVPSSAAEIHRLGRNVDAWCGSCGR
jgi:hypothetical protein